MEKERFDVMLESRSALSGDGSGEMDFLPEYCHYRDEGCEFASSCLSCPFQKCIFELPGGKQHWLKRRRDSEVVRLFADEGRGVKELAVMFGISQRTVQRIIERAKDD